MSSAGGIAVATLLLIVAGCRSRSNQAASAPPIRVRCAPVERRAIRDVRVVRGTVATPPDRDAIISAQVPGRILRVLFREGDVVAAGAVVAEVESRTARDTLRQADAQLAQARAAREAAASEATRQEHLFEKGISARQSLEQARASLAAAEAQVAAASAQVDASRQGVERAEVRAPIGGVVVRIFRRVGEVVDGTGATPILEVADANVLELAAGVPPSDLVVLHPAQPATLTFDALPGRRFEGSVRTVSPAIDPATGVGAVRIALASSDVRPPLGLAGQAEVAVSQPHDAILIPSIAVRNAGGAKTEVVACVDGHAAVRTVETGVRTEGRVEIRSGLDTTARVVIDEVGALEDGAAIEEHP